MMRWPCSHPAMAYAERAGRKRVGVQRASWIGAAVALACAGIGAPRVAAVETLALNTAPGSAIVAPGDTVTVTLDVSGLVQAINGVQAFLHYDDTLLSLVAIDPNPVIAGVGWDQAIETDTGGDIDYVVVMNSFGASTLADHTVATLTFTALALGTTNVTFRADSPPVLTKLTVATNNFTLLPSKVDSGNITISAQMPPRIAGLEVFYSGRFADAADPTKVFLAPGSTATLSNITAYTNGITGIRVFFDDIVTFATTPAAAFSFDWTTVMGTTFSPVTDAGTAITVTAADVGGITVVTIALMDNHVRRRWLRTTIDATQVSMGGVLLDGDLVGNPVVLPGGDAAAGGNAVFYVGNLSSDVTGDRRTTTVDRIQQALEVNLFVFVPIENVFDVDKDGRVRTPDMTRTSEDINLFFVLPLIAP